jgi:hypothetical protein
MASTNLELAGRDSWPCSLDQEQRDTLHSGITSSGCNRKVVGLHARSDKFLFTTDLQCSTPINQSVQALVMQSHTHTTYHKVIAIANSNGLNVGHIASGIRLGDCQRNDLLALDQRHSHLLLHLLGSQCENRWKCDVDRQEACCQPTASTTCQFIPKHQIVEDVKLATRTIRWRSSVLLLATGVVHVVVDVVDQYCHRHRYEW